MKRLLLIMACLAASFLSYSQSAPDSLVWLTDVNKAHQLSKATGKPIFAFFTGSDWCGWCRKLQADVFSKAAFKAWAANEVVLLELDFPRRKVLPPETVQQNQALQQFFKISGYPTIWLFCMSQNEEKKQFLISPHGTLGYPRDFNPGAEEVKFLEDANKLLDSKTCL